MTTANSTTISLATTSSLHPTCDPYSLLFDCLPTQIATWSLSSGPPKIARSILIKKPELDWTSTANNWTSGCGWGLAQRGAVAVARSYHVLQPVVTDYNQLQLLLYTLWAWVIITVANLGACRRRAFDAAPLPLSAASLLFVVVAVAGQLGGLLQRQLHADNSLKLYTPPTAPRDPPMQVTLTTMTAATSSSLSNNFNTSSSSNTAAASSRPRPQHLGTGEYKARSTATTAGKVTTTTARRWQGDDSDGQQDDIGGDDDKSTTI
ncbi:hypothetical protein EDB83DRAFT_2318775 [Lactarius deliciosus]|nr:hypothetical protein EDB83DRAFT_2318775 [Lactarius deliciosus]